MRFVHYAFVLSALAAAPALAAPPIVIDQHMFMPAVITIHPGATVTWINKDSDVHNVASDDQGRTFQSPLLDANQGFSFTFTAPGTFRYHCSVHPDMQGTIVVQ